MKVDSVRGIVLWGASIAIAAAILALGYIIGSDLRGRSAAMVATIQARAKLADTMVRTSGDLFSPTPASATLQLIALPGASRVQNIREKEDDEKGWKAVALQSNGEESTKYLITKGQRHKWVDAEDVVLD